MPVSVISAVVLAPAAHVFCGTGFIREGAGFAEEDLQGFLGLFGDKSPPTLLLLARSLTATA
ncbi:hypothetical protein AFK24_00745 [Pseudomonas syringae]|uniref:Uncharacterized protein n=1 Tax=Pseudomonas syringae TaxID=317 RepID=A0A1C7ZAT5_PSESX|nr:hypothetical protein AFK24_00745 [Pseudomonas syringae]